nr:MAG TPA: hypothetical protein [Myoviridae sp. ctEXz2]
MRSLVCIRLFCHTKNPYYYAQNEYVRRKKWIVL